MHLKNVILLFCLTIGFAIQTDNTAIQSAAAPQKEIKWDSIEHPGPRGNSKLVLTGIATVATMLGISAFAYIVHDSGMLKKWYRYIKKHPFKTAAAIAALVGVTTAVAKKGSMPSLLAAQPAANAKK